MNRDIYCNKCGTYVGTIRDAKLKKGLVFICADCHDDDKPYDFSNKDSGGDFGKIFDDIFKGKFK